jgi:DNA polymerase V
MMEIFRCEWQAVGALPLLFRSVAAGFPSPADDFIEDEIDLSRLLISNRPATFLVRVRGNSMVGAKMFNGDLAIVDRSLVPQVGDVVVVDIDGERSFKVWQRGEKGVELCFANPDFPPFPVAPDAVIEVWGIVTGSISPGRRAGLM